MRFIDPLGDPSWDEKILAFKECSVFHTSGWAHILCDTYGFSNSYLVETDGDRIRFLLPIMEVRSLLTGKRGISLPFTDFCEPLVSGETPSEATIDALVTRGRKQGWRYFELRGGARLFGTEKPTTMVFEHTLDLSPPEETLLAGVKESTRRNIKKAKREGVEVVIGTSMEMVESFYRLNCLTRRDHGLPPQPLAFFRNLHRYLVAKGQGCVALAMVRNQVAGGAVYLHFGRQALYKFGASDQRFLSLRPNDLVMWEAIRWCRARDLKSLSLGRTESHHAGLRRYKIAWGVREQERFYYRYGFAAGKFARIETKAAGKTSSMIFRHLPLRASQAIGSVLYRHVA